MSRRALITGVGGQDGSLLAELLLDHGYDVFGVVRRSASSYQNLAGISDRVELIQADLNDELALVRALRACRPHEVYNLASVSFVPMSWEQPVLTAQLAAVGATPRVLVADETRHSGGVGEGVVTALVEAGYDGRIARVASCDSFIPLGDAANLVLLGEEQIEAAARRMLEG